MAFKTLPINTFIAQRYSDRSVQKIVETWPVEASDMIARLTDYFREMGIYEVSHGHEKTIFETMVLQLRHSPEIASFVQQMHQAERRRKRKSPAD